MIENASEPRLILHVAKQQPLSLETAFDGLLRDDPQFLPSDSAACLSEFLTQRALILQQ